MPANAGIQVIVSSVSKLQNGLDSRLYAGMTDNRRVDFQSTNSEPFGFGAEGRSVSPGKELS